MSQERFTHDGWEYVAYSEDCPKCKKPLAYHGCSNTHAEVSCPRCGAGVTRHLPLPKAEKPEKKEPEVYL